MSLKNFYHHYICSTHRIADWNRRCDHYLVDKSRQIIHKHPRLRLGVAGSLILIKTGTRILTQIATPVEKLAIACHHVFQAVITDRVQFLEHTKKTGIYLLAVGGSILMIPVSPILGIKDGIQAYQTALQPKTQSPSTDPTQGSGDGGDNDIPPGPDGKPRPKPITHISQLPPDLQKYVFTFFNNPEKENPHLVVKNWHTQCIVSTIAHENDLMDRFLNFLTKNLKLHGYHELAVYFDTLLTTHNLKASATLDNLQKKLTEVRTLVVEKLCTLDDAELTILKLLKPARVPQFFEKIFELVSIKKRYDALCAATSANLRLDPGILPLAQEAFNLGLLELAAQIADSSVHRNLQFCTQLVAGGDIPRAIRLARFLSGYDEGDRLRLVLIDQLLAQDNVALAMKLAKEVDVYMTRLRRQEAHVKITEYLVRNGRGLEAMAMIPKDLHSYLHNQCQLAGAICYAISQGMNTIEEIDAFFKDPVFKKINDQISIQTSFIQRAVANNNYKLAFEMYQHIDKARLNQINQYLATILQCAVTQNDAEWAYTYVDCFVEDREDHRDKSLCLIVTAFIAARKIDQAKQAAAKITKLRYQTQALSEIATVE